MSTLPKTIMCSLPKIGVSRILTTSAYPWLVIGLCAAFMFYKYVLQVSISVMSHDLMYTFQLNAFSFGNLAAAFFYSYVVVQLFAGILIDKYSPRALTVLAIGVCASGAHVFASAHSLLIAHLGRILMGAGAAFATLSFLKMTAIWFPPHRTAFVSGLTATGAMLGAVCGQMPLAWAATQVGWRNSMVDCAILGLIIASLFYAIVRNRNPAQPVSVDDTAAGEFNWQEVRRALGNKQNWLLLCYSGLILEPIIVFGGLWGPAYLQQVCNLPMTQAASLASLSFIGLAVGGPLIGLLSQYLNQRRAVMIGSAWVTLLAFLALVYLPLNLFWVGVLSFLMGFSSGACTLSFAVARTINKLALFTTVVSLINSGEALLGAISEPLLGKFLDLQWHGALRHGVHFFSTHNYRIAFSFLPVYLALALVILYFVKEPVLQKT